MTATIIYTDGRTLPAVVSVLVSIHPCPGPFTAATPIVFALFADGGGRR